MLNGLLPALEEECPGRNSFAAVFKGELIGVFDGLDGAVEGLRERDIDPQNTDVVQINPPKRHQILIEG